MRNYILGVLTVLVVLPLGAYLFVRGGGVSLATTAPPLPMERAVAEMSLEASIGKASAVKSPVPMNDENMLMGARIYKMSCELCHGLPGKPQNDFALAMFPQPPELMGKEKCTDDPVGAIYWKVTHGIRLSGMPAFDKILTDQQRWQVSMVLQCADKLPDAAKKVLAQ